MNYNFELILLQALPKFLADLCEIQSSESNYSALLYHHLIQTGYKHTQICVEMYSSNLVRDGVRPDLVIFDEEIVGRFNYYQNCDKTKDNTNAKREHLRCLFEVKGGAQQNISGLSNYFPNDPLCNELRDDPERRNKTQNARLALDIEKLGMWAKMFGTKSRDYVFLAIDMRNPKGYWSADTREIFGQYAAEHGVQLVYYAQDAQYFWHYDTEGNSRQIGIAHRTKI